MVRSTRRAMLPNRCYERESRWVLLPRVPWGSLGCVPFSCDSLHRPGLRVLLAVPLERLARSMLHVV